MDTNTHSGVDGKIRAEILGNLDEELELEMEETIGPGATPDAGFRSHRAC